MSSHAFAPSVGGIESVSQMLAEEFVRLGHELRVITQTPGTGGAAYPFELRRRPSTMRLLGLMNWCDVYFQNNISLPRLWPALLLRTPCVVAHHVWIPRRGLAGRCKRGALRFVAGVAVSAAIARDLSTASTLIPNPYDDGTFRELPDVARERDIVFVGRLVSDKGAAVLLRALDLLRTRGQRPTATIVGSGPEEADLRRRVAQHGLDSQVQFAGATRGEALVRLLNAHRLIAIPSLWHEPFGLVALEGMACGCVPVGSAGGGLSEAIADCGVTFPNGDVLALSDALEGLLRDASRRLALRARVRAHLRRHTRTAVAAEYLRVFEEVLAGARGRRAVRTVVGSGHRP